MRLALLLFFLISFNFIIGQEEGFYTEDFVYVENLKSVCFYAGSNPLNYPVTNLTGSPRLFLKFDDLEADYKDYYYKIVHCDMDWNISDLEENEYLEGFNKEEIENKNNSSFTLDQYTNYYLTLPNADIRWIISGNYLLIVMDEDDNVVITKRFLVVENYVKINAIVDHAKDVSKFNTHHSVNLTLDIKDYNVVDPLRELRVSVLQNDKWIDAKPWLHRSMLLEMS